MKFNIAAREVPITVLFEPIGHEHVLNPSDHVTIEWVKYGDGDDVKELLGAVEHSSDSIVISTPGGYDMRAWSSDGTQLDV